MTRPRAARAGFRLWAALLLTAGLIGGAAVVLGNRHGGAQLPERAEAQRPTLLMLSSLPLIFPETFAIDQGGSPTLTALERRYRVQPIGVTDAASLSGKGLLLMAHPLAQPAEALVDLDAWVRGGGRLVLLADPRLDWPSSRSLGDRLRPPPAFADTGLLKHWGLTLYAPETDGPVEWNIDSRQVRFGSPGSLEGGCRIEGNGVIARCVVGRGKATVIADADFLNVENADSDNLYFLLAELDRIERL